MSRSLEQIKEMLCDELDHIADQGKLTAGTLDTVDKLTHSIKSVETILAMKESGYSGDPYPRYHYTDGRYRGYSRDGMIEKLRRMLDDAQSEKERKALRSCISQMEG